MPVQGEAQVTQPEPVRRFPAPTDKPLRIALVISGAVSLGSYEAGALTALLGLIRSSGGQMVVDTIVGASAGSITGLLLAHALVAGGGTEDEETLWVNETDVELLLKGRADPDRPRAPLSPSLLVEWARTRLTRPSGSPLQRDPVYLVLSVANLQGLTYRMLMRDEAIRADTYRDAATFVLDPDTTGDRWEQAMRAAVASSAHAFAFSAVWLDREREEYPPEIVWNAGQKGFWYTDGGTVYNEPFGMALDALYSPEDLHLPPRGPFGENDRVILLVHPHPDDPISAWPPGGQQPVFGQSSLRAFGMQRAQSLYQDLLTLEKYNGRLYWRDRLQQEMEAHGLSDEEWVRKLAEEATRDRAWRRALTKKTADPVEQTASAGSTGQAPPPLQVLLDAATGTAGKHPAWVEVVSPDLDPRVKEGTATIAELLAGERMGHFLGFADVRARRSDFRLGYENFRLWWHGDDAAEGFRDRCDLPDLEVPARDWPAGWEPFGNFNLGDVPLGRRLRWGIRLLWRYYREVRALRKRLKSS